MDVKPLNLLAAILVAVMLVTAVSVCVPVTPTEVTGADEWWIVRPGEPLWDEPVESHRSACWAATRAEWLKSHPRCEFKGCRSGPNAAVEPHHCIPYSVRPELECDQRNLITLCRGGENHHLWVGHQGNFRESNQKVRSDCRDGVLPSIGAKRRAEWETRKAKDRMRLRGQFGVGA